MAEGKELNLQDRLTEYGKLGVLALRTDVEKVSATRKTIDSIRFELEITSDFTFILRFLGREFFKALETGRGPRKGSTYQQFDISLMDYMEARNMFKPGSTQKQKESQAKSLAWYINKFGDSVFRSGGREVYSETLIKLAQELKRAITSDFKQFIISEIVRV